MKVDVSKYTGEWIAIVDRKIVAHGKKFKETYLKVKKKYPEKKPLFAKIPSKETMIF